jgi:hypothetical protein
MNTIPKILQYTRTDFSRSLIWMTQQSVKKKRKWLTHSSKCHAEWSTLKADWVNHLSARRTSFTRSTITFCSICLTTYQSCCRATATSWNISNQLDYLMALLTSLYYRYLHQDPNFTCSLSIQLPVTSWHTCNLLRKLWDISQSL